MLLTGKTCVVVLTGPLTTQEKGNKTGTSDITRRRLSAAVRVAKARDCPLYAPIKDDEAWSFMHDLEAICTSYGYARERVVMETGAEHTLANAWYALRFAYAFDFQTLVPVTSFWHGDRAEVAFRGVAQGVGVVQRRTVAIGDVVRAGYSRRPHVRRFERRAMVPDEAWKREAERARVQEYVRKLGAHGPVSGFVPHPDVLCPHVQEEGRIYQSVVEPARRVAAG